MVVLQVEPAMIVHLIAGSLLQQTSVRRTEVEGLFLCRPTLRSLPFTIRRHR